MAHASPCLVACRQSDLGLVILKGISDPRHFEMEHKVLTSPGFGKIGPVDVRPSVWKVVFMMAGLNRQHGKCGAGRVA